MRDESDDAQHSGDRYRVTPDDEAGHRLLSVYLSRRRRELVQLKTAARANDYTEIRRIGHNLAGSGAAYGLNRVSTIGAQLELAADRGSARGVAESVAELERFLATVTIADPP